MHFLRGWANNCRGESPSAEHPASPRGTSGPGGGEKVADGKKELGIAKEEDKKRNKRHSGRS